MMKREWSWGILLGLLLASGGRVAGQDNVLATGGARHADPSDLGFADIRITEEHALANDRRLFLVEAEVRNSGDGTFTDVVVEGKKSETVELRPIRTFARREEPLLPGEIWEIRDPLRLLVDPGDAVAARAGILDGSFLNLPGEGEYGEDFEGLVEESITIVKETVLSSGQILMEITLDVRNGGNTAFPSLHVTVLSRRFRQTPSGPMPHGGFFTDSISPTTPATMPTRTDFPIRWKPF